MFRCLKTETRLFVFLYNFSIDSMHDIAPGGLSQKVEIKHAYASDM